mgnify:CR=1 FL=1
MKLILNTFSYMFLLRNQINKPNNEAVVITQASEKKTTIYPEEINIVNDDEVITYVRANKSAEVVPAKTEMELLPFGKEQEDRMLTEEYYVIQEYHQN